MSEQSAREAADFFWVKLDHTPDGVVLTASADMSSQLCIERLIAALNLHRDALPPKKAVVTIDQGEDRHD